MDDLFIFAIYKMYDFILATQICNNIILITVIIYMLIIILNKNVTYDNSIKFFLGLLLISIIFNCIYLIFNYYIKKGKTRKFIFFEVLCCIFLIYFGLSTIYVDEINNPDTPVSIKIYNEEVSIISLLTGIGILFFTVFFN